MSRCAACVPAWRVTLLLGCAVLAFFAGAACRVEAPEAGSEPAPTAVPVAAETLIIALPTGAADADYAGAAAFEALVEGLSRGAVAVEIAGREQPCGAPRQCLDDLREGSIDITRATTEDLAALFPEIRILDVPYLFEDGAIVDLVYTGAFYARLRDALVARAGLRPVAIGTSAGWRTLATTGPAVRTPDDVRGLTLWAGSSPIEAELVTALGAVPATGDRREIAAELERGAVNGVTLPLVDIVALGLHERIRHVTLDRHGYDAALWLMNDSSHQALPASLRRVVQAGFDELTRLTLAVPADRQADAVRSVQAAGGEVHLLSPEERKAFLMAVGRVATGYVDTYGHEWLVWLEGAIAEAEREVAVARPGTSPGSP